MKKIINKHWIAALFAEVFGVILYSMMMSQQLTNTFDGLWHQNYHQAGISELASGRWLLYFVDKVCMGLHADPIISLVSLTLFILGFIFVLDLFGINDKFVGFISSALFISSTVICNTLSYRYTSLGYGFAFLFAVLGVYLAIKLNNRTLAVLVSGVSLGLSMACYQAYLSVFCITALFYIVSLCNVRKEADINEKGRISCSLLRIGGSLLIGAVFYIISLFFFLKVSNVSLSDYNGIGSITLSGLIRNLPKNIVKSFRYFGVYFMADTLKINRLQYFGILYIFLALLTVLFIYIGIKAWKIQKSRIVVLVFAALLVPVACNAYMLLAGDKLELQMTAGLAMLFPLTAITAFAVLKKRFLKNICVIFCAILLYGSSVQVWFDQEAMYEGRNACETIATQVLTDLKDASLLSSNYEYFFVGVPARNQYFSVSEIYPCANGYAQMGNFWVSGNCCQMSYGGLIGNYMGFNLPMSSLSFENLQNTCDISEIPTFPQDGYITLTDDHIIIIKISEHEKYCEYALYDHLN